MKGKALYAKLKCWRLPSSAFFCEVYLLFPSLSPLSPPLNNNNNKNLNTEPVFVEIIAVEDAVGEEGTLNIWWKTKLN